jgi:hypothetical protein
MVLSEVSRQFTSKWEETGLLEGLASDQQKGAVAMMLENQAKQLLDEASRTGTNSNSEQWAGVALPLVRRVFGEIAAQNFVSVQPMNLPSGLVFYLDYKYGTDQNANPAFNGSSVYGGTTGRGAQEQEVPTDAAVNGLYGAGRFGYSINDVVAENVTIASETSASLSDVNFDSSLSASIAAGEVVKLTIAASQFNNPDLNGVRAFQVSAEAGVVSNLSAFNYVQGSNVILFASASAGGSYSGVVDVAYQAQPTDASRGDFEDGAVASPYGADIDIPEINLDVKSKPIVAKTRKLKAQWTPELAQDLNAYHSIDAEAELTSVLSDYIAAEIDLEILDMLIQNAVTTEYWSVREGYEFDSVTNQFVQGTNVLAYQKNTWFQTLGTKINKVSNKIHQLTMRGGANFLVASPDVCTILESIPAFNVTAEKDAMSFAAGVTQVGSLSNRYTVYKNPYMTENTILVGYKGSNFLESGAVYAPYIPLIMTPTIYDPTNFSPRRGIMTRYAKEITRGEFYGRIYVEGLERL